MGTGIAKKFDKESINDILQELKSALIGIYGSRFKKLILYGSFARNDAGPDSDIDVMVVLGDIASPAREIDAMLDVVTDLNLKYNVLISVYPVSEYSLRTVKSPLILSVSREGINI